MVCMPSVVQVKPFNFSSIAFSWQKISDPNSIAEILKQVYVDHSTKVDNVFSRILETTQHPAAAASFASIMFAPQGQLSFWEALSRWVMLRYLKYTTPSVLLNGVPCICICRCQESSVPISLMYGKEDPWVRPVWGLQVKRRVPETPYYEISPAGHCPHDEVPEVCLFISFIARNFFDYLSSSSYTVIVIMTPGLSLIFVELKLFNVVVFKVLYNLTCNGYNFLFPPYRL